MDRISCCNLKKSWIRNIIFLVWNSRFGVIFYVLNFFRFGIPYPTPPPHGDEATCGPFYLYGVTFIPAWISNYIHHKVWDEITYPFLNFNGATVEVQVWISNFIPYFTGLVISYPWD